MPGSTSPSRSQPGRTDATQEQTDVDSFEALEPIADGFRNYLRAGDKLPPETLLLDKANLLVADRAGDDGADRRHAGAGTNHRRLDSRCLHRPPRTLTNDFFVNLLESVTEWRVSATSEGVYEGGGVTATAVDLVFGSHSQLRAYAEVYASDDGKEKFVRDFVEAWDKVMNLDRFDLD